MNLTTQQALQLRAALAALDGLDRAVEVNGKTALIKKPFKFSGKTRLKIARNVRTLEGVFADYDTARKGLVRELAEGGDETPKEKLPEFHRRHGALLAEPVEVALAPLTEDDLNLDDNEIPHGAVALLLQHLIFTAENTANAEK